MLSEKKKIITATLLSVTFLFYSGFLYISLPVKDKMAASEVKLGKSVWQRYNCNACHQIYGLGGFLGPDLTNSFSLRGSAYIRAFLQSGVGAMPAFHLTPGEMNALLAFLQNIDASGKADPKTFSINLNGTIEQ